MPTRARIPNLARRPVFETLEARVLYSADLAPLVEMAAVPAAEARTLDGSGEFVDDPYQVVQVRRYEIAFLDAAAPASLLEALSREQMPERTLEVVRLSAEHDGIAQVSDALSARRELSAVHILSHGADGVVQLGAGRLDFDSLLEHARDIRGWSAALAPHADLLLYGCDVARGSAGASLMQALARLTGADVAASSDRTAGAAQGGDWDLEARTGNIEAQSALDLARAANWSGALAIAPTVVVPAAVSVPEDAAVAITGLSVSDPEGDLASVALSVSDGSLSLDLSGGASVSAGANQSAGMTVTGSQTQINAALATLAYQGTADFNGTDSLAIVATGTDGLSQGAAVAIGVSAVNDPPNVTAPAARTTLENRQVVFLPGQVRIADADAGTAALQVTISAVNGRISVGGTAGLSFSIGDGRSDAVMVFSGTLADINATLNNLRFVPTTDFTGLALMSLQVDDAGSSGAGGAQAGAATVHITVGAAAATPGTDPGVGLPVPAPVLPSFVPTPDSGAAAGAPMIALQPLVQGDAVVVRMDSLAARLALTAGLPADRHDPAGAGAGEGDAFTRGDWPMRVGAQWLESLLTLRREDSSRSSADGPGSVSPPAAQPPAQARVQPLVPGLSSGTIADSQRATEGADDDEVARLEQALTYVLGVAISAGAVLWANRSLGLLAPVAVSMPAWRSIDPLPALAPEAVDAAPADSADVLEQAAESMVFRAARGGGAQP